MTSFIYCVVAMLGLLAGFIIGFVTGKGIGKEELERIREDDNYYRKRSDYYDKECDRVYRLYFRDIDRFDRAIKEKNDIIAHLIRQLNL